jgi:ABC-type glycerol-3-phosphate transport system permease component
MTRLNLIQTKIPIISAHIMINIAFIVWFMITFFITLPEEMEDSARIDGASEMQLLTKIIFPLVMPGVASVAILAFMTSWNEYLYGVIFIQSPKNYTIPLILATLNSEQELADYGLIAAGGTISLIPILLFVIFAQNYLISGLSSGAVKE